MRRRRCSSSPATLDGDEATGAKLVARALEEPLKQIAVNAGLEGGVIVEKVRSLKGANGLNAATGEYEDLVKAGVIDAAKVTRSALQNAASIAALFLTTEAVIADKPEPAAAGRWDARWHARHGWDGRLLKLAPPARRNRMGRPSGAPHSCTRGQIIDGGGHDATTADVHGDRGRLGDHGRRVRGWRPAVRPRCRSRRCRPR